MTVNQLNRKVDRSIDRKRRALRHVAMKPAIRRRQSSWVASRCWPLSIEGGRERSSLETNIRGFMADSAVSLSFEQDWTCLSKGEVELPTIGYSRIGQYIKNVIYIYSLMELMRFHGYSTS